MANNSGVGFHFCSVYFVGILPSLSLGFLKFMILEIFGFHVDMFI